MLGPDHAHQAEPDNAESEKHNGRMAHDVLPEKRAGQCPGPEQQDKADDHEQQTNRHERPEHRLVFGYAFLFADGGNQFPNDLEQSRRKDKTHSYGKYYIAGIGNQNAHTGRKQQDRNKVCHCQQDRIAYGMHSRDLLFIFPIKPRTLYHTVNKRNLY